MQLAQIYPDNCKQRRFGAQLKITTTKCENYAATKLVVATVDAAKTISNFLALLLQDYARDCYEQIAGNTRMVMVEPPIFVVRPSLKAVLGVHGCLLNNLQRTYSDVYCKIQLIVIMTFFFYFLGRLDLKLSLIPIGDTVGTVALFVEKGSTISQMTWAQLFTEINSFEKKAWSSFKGTDLCSNQLYRVKSNGIYIANGAILTVQESLYMAVLCRDDFGNTHLCSDTHSLVCRV